MAELVIRVTIKEKHLFVSWNITLDDIMANPVEYFGKPLKALNAF